MFVICDENNVIQDIASEKENLSRGYDFPNHKIYENIEIGIGIVGDKIVDGKVLIDIDRIQEEELRTERREMVTKEVREIAIAKLKSEGKLPPEYTEP